jgi:hypothetical protein
MYFKDSNDFLIKNLATIIKPQINITLNQSLILGISIFFITTILIYPNYLMHITFELITSSLI